MKLVHLVYIHGFNGDETTFQSFPTDLQQYLSATIPAHLGLTVQSSLYPTYKSVKPISSATRNFLRWLETQTPGPVILLGHSMGGLLAAEAATDGSNNPDGHPGAKPRRIVGMVAFDTPYLGMHPHVVVSGITSLLPKTRAEDVRVQGGAGAGLMRKESELNRHPQVHLVDENVTEPEGSNRPDDSVLRPASHTRSVSSPSTPPPSLLPPSTQLSPAHPSTRPPSPNPRAPSPSLVDHALLFLSSHSNDPLVRWARKHADDPLGAGKRWIVEHFQFGACMFDPVGLKARYTRLVEWQGGVWVNYWTQTVPQGKSGDKRHRGEHGQDGRLDVYNYNGFASVNGSSQLSSSASKMSGRHFVVLPDGLGSVLGGGEKWEKVLVEGVADEVGAHCGLFIRGMNLEYDALVDRVGRKVIGWCESLVA